VVIAGKVGIYLSINPCILKKCYKWSRAILLQHREILRPRCNLMDVLFSTVATAIEVAILSRTFFGN